MTSSMPNTAINGTLRDILTSVIYVRIALLRYPAKQLANKSSAISVGQTSHRAWPSRRNPLVQFADEGINLQHRSFSGSFNNALRILSWITFTEHGRCPPQEFLLPRGTTSATVSMCHATIDSIPVLQPTPAIRISVNCRILCSVKE